MCKSCRKIDSHKHYTENKEEISAKKMVYMKTYRKEKESEIIQRNAHYYQKNKKVMVVKSANWKKNNPGKRRAIRAKRRAAELHATLPGMTEEHWKQIQNIYIEAARMTKETGIKYEVDHIIPLQGKNVCGLHVPWNLQIITAEENRIKHNKVIIT